MKKLLLPFLFLFFLSCGDVDNSIEVQQSELISSVYASCTVKAEDEYRVNSAVSGTITSIPVDEGALLDSGAVIMTIDNTNPSLNAENALLALELARDNYEGSASSLKSLKINMDLAKDKLDDDSLNYKRQKELWDKGIGSKVQLEQRELAFRNAKSQYEMLKVQYQQTRNQSQTALRQAENNYRQSLENKDEFEIRSAISGKVFDITKETGEVVRFQEVVAVIGKANDFLLELEIDQEDIMSIEAGQKVYVRLEAFANEVMEGEITRIQPILNPTTLTFTAEAQFDGQQKNLFPGLTGEANVVIETRENCLNIPVSYLIDDSLVYVGKKETQVVKTGLRSLDRIEITDGLEAGQKIYKPAEE